MKVFRYKNGNKRTMSGRKIGLLISFFIIIAMIAFFLIFDDISGIFALIFVISIILFVIILMFLWLWRAQKIESVYILDDDRILWRLFIRQQSKIHVTYNIVNRVDALINEFQAGKELQSKKRDDKFMIGIVLLCKEESELKKEFYKNSSIIKELHNPKVTSSSSKNFNVIYTDEKGQTKSKKIPQEYYELEEAIKNV